MIAGFTTTYVISAYYHWSCEFESRSWWDVLDTAVCDKVCQWLETGRWFSPGTNKIDCHNITEMLLKVVLNNINLNHSINVNKSRRTVTQDTNSYERYQIILICNLPHDRKTVLNPERYVFWIHIIMQCLVNGTSIAPSISVDVRVT